MINFSETVTGGSSTAIIITIIVLLIIVGVVIWLFMFGPLKPKLSSSDSPSDSSSDLPLDSPPLQPSQRVLIPADSQPHNTTQQHHSVDDTSDLYNLPIKQKLCEGIPTLGSIGYHKSEFSNFDEVVKYCKNQCNNRYTPNCDKILIAQNNNIKDENGLLYQCNYYKKSGCNSQKSLPQSLSNYIINIYTKKN